MSKGGIVLTDTTQTVVKHNQYLAKLVAMGPAAFTSPRLVPENFAGRLPEVGDWVMINRLQGMMFEYQENKGLDPVVLRVCADDAILAILPDPEGWKVGGV
jgi:co-chaperonin GroES (HSP10)